MEEGGKVKERKKRMLLNNKGLKKTNIALLKYAYTLYILYSSLWNMVEVQLSLDLCRPTL